MTAIPNIKIKDWIENLENRGRISFSLSQLLEANPEISETAIRSALSRLSKKGKVVPIHKGFYLIISSEYALRGIIPPVQFIASPSPIVLAYPLKLRFNITLPKLVTFVMFSFET